jgi:putative transport protein
MEWITLLFREDSVAHAVLILSLVIALGLSLGSVRVFGISLGVAGVLFSGLIFGHLGLTIHHEVLEFAREFGLILFVFTIGLQVGPGFFASLKRQGLSMNLLAASIVVFGALITVAIHYLAAVSVPAAAGLFSGATTNTPSLAAAGQALRQFPDQSAETLKLPGLAYAVSYPFGIIGTILSMLLVKKLFRIDIPTERRALEETQRQNRQEIGRQALVVENPNLRGIEIRRIPGLSEAKAVISRVQRAGKTQVARPDTVLQPGDVVLVVAPPAGLAMLRLAIGQPSPLDLGAESGAITARRVIVTKRALLGKTVDQLQLLSRFDVNVTRVARGDQEFTPTSDLSVQFGDTLTLVGGEAGVVAASAAVGNSFKALNHPHIIPIFVGIALGILLGSMPLAFPGMPAPVKLGLAGGPLIVAILLSRLGHFGPLVWYMPLNANYMLREIGIALFLSCVGLHSGDSFMEIVRHGEGLRWMLLGMAITFIPLLAIGVVARAVFKLNYVSLCGMMAGSMTDPPALAFAHTITGSEGAAIAYVTVYPLVMILRVFFAQLLILLLWG